MSEQSVLAPGMSMKVQEAPEIPTRTFRLDLKEGRIGGYVDELAAVKQAAMIALLSERFKTRIYGPQYGSELDSIIGWQDATRDLIEAEIDRAVRDALIRDSRILNVASVTTTFEDDAAHVEVELETVYGDTALEVIY